VVTYILSKQPQEVLMNEEEKTRQQEIQDYKDTIEEMQKEATEVKEIAQAKIEINKGICVEMDTLNDTLSKEKVVAESLTKEVVASMPRDVWENMQTLFGHTANNYKGVISLRRDMASAKTQGESFATTATTLVGSNSTTALSATHIMAPYARHHPQAGKVLAIVKFTPTWIDDIAFIKAELKKLTPDLSGEFEAVAAEMSGIGHPNLKHRVLLSLRSVFFDRLLNIVAPEAQYSQTSWFKRTPTTQGAAPFRRMRFCQPKFFIFDNRDETAFPQSMIDAVNKASAEMALHFDEMSEYGKNGADSHIVDNCYRQTMTSFANAIKLRNQIQKQP
jgi:regulator of replication initiation timing